MSSNEKAGQPPHTQANPEYYPPPPPGPPPNQNPLGQHPVQQHGQYQPQHSNETPLKDSNAPAYDPAHPHFASPPHAEGIYDDDPIQPQSAAHQKPAHGSAQPVASKPGWGDRLSGWGLKAAAPLNVLANKLGSESFLPDTMNKEVEKAARILRSFCKDGVYTDTQDAPPTISPLPDTHEKHDKHDKNDKHGKEKEKEKNKSRTLLTIPAKVISRAVGLAIFTTGRVGFHVSGATGSGVLIARLPDGSWSPPSGIQVHSVGAGFVIGADIYDCVVVINTKEALEAFTRTRMSLGSDLAVVAGPWGAGGSLDFAAPATDRARSKSRDRTSAAQPDVGGSQTAGGQAFGGGPAAPGQPQVTTGAQTTTAPAQSSPADLKPGTSKDRKPSPLRQALSKPVYAYVKSRGFYAGVQIDGTVVTERKDANAAFYGSQLPVEKIIRGEVPSGNWHGQVKGLFDVVKGAEGPKGQAGGFDAPDQHATGAHPAGAPSAAPGAGSFVPTASTGYYSGTSGGPPLDAATASMQHMHLGGDAAAVPGGQTQPGSGAQAYYPPPPPMTKEQEAAVESARAAAHGGGSDGPPPPGYTEQVHTEELPPGYVDDGRVHQGVGDHKMPPPPPQ